MPQPPRHPLARRTGVLALAIALSVMIAACAPTADEVGAPGAPGTPGAATATPAAAAPTASAPTQPAAPPATTPAATPVGPAATAAAVPDADLVIAVQLPAVGYDPRIRIDPGSVQRMHAVYETLLRVDANLALEPRLATGWDVADDGRTITLSLRDDVRFHDGWRFTSADVRFTIETGGGADQLGLVRAVAGQVERIETPDDRTVVLRLGQSASQVLYDLARMPIVPANATADLDTRPVGTGPYAFEAIGPDGSLHLVRFDDYWDDHVGPERVAFQQVANPADVADRLLDGRIHLSQRAFAASDAARFASSNQVVLADVVGTVSTYVGFRVAAPALADPAVRRAISAVMPRERIAAEAFGGTAVPSLTMVPAFAAWAPADPGAILGDATAAAALLADVGASLDSPLVLLTNDAPQRVAIATLVAEALAEVGVAVRVESLDFSTFLQRVDRGDYDLYVLALSGSHNPAATLGTGGLNYERFADDALAAALAEAATLDPTSDAGAERYRAAAEVWLTASPRAFLTLGIVTGAHAAGVEGWSPHPVDGLAFQDLQRVALR